MKKYFIPFLLLTMFLASCIRDNELYNNVVPELVQVVSGADIAFKARGGEGDITVKDSGEPLVVTTDQSEWCHATVKGNTIHVIVDEHIGLESRYAVLKLTSGNKSGKTIVQQFGVIVKSFSPSNLAFKNNADEISIPYDANETIINATTDADWVTIINNPEALIIKVSENSEKDYREATVSWNIGMMKGSFSVSQFDLKDAGLLGDWKWHGKQTGNNRDFPMNATLEENTSGSYKLTLVYTSSSVNINIVIDPLVLDKNRLMIPLGQAVGTYATRSVTYQAFSMMAKGNARLAFSDATTTGALPMVLEEDDGKWKATADVSEYPDMFFRFEMWPNEKHESTSASGLILKDIYLEK